MTRLLKMKKKPDYARRKRNLWEERGYEKKEENGTSAYGLQAREKKENEIVKIV